MSSMSSVGVGVKSEELVEVEVCGSIWYSRTSAVTTRVLRFARTGEMYGCTCKYAAGDEKSGESPRIDEHEDKVRQW